MILDLQVIQPQTNAVNSVKIPSARIAAVLKKPLQGMVAVALSDGTLFPCPQGGDHTSFEGLTNKLEPEGFKAFATPSGGSALINFDHVMFYAQEAIGQYALVLGNGFGTSVKASEQDIQEGFGDKPASQIIA